MKARVTKEEFDELDKVLQKEYTLEKSGTYLAKIDPVDGLVLDNVTGLKTTITALRTEKKDLEKRVEAFKDYDPDEVREALEKSDEIKNWSPDKKTAELVTQREKAVEQKFTKDLNTEKTKSTTLRAQLEQVLIDGAAKVAISAVGAKTKLLLPHVKSHLKIEEVSGNLVARVVDDEGKVIPTQKTGSMEPMSIEEYVTTLKSDPDLAIAFPGSGASGSGASGSGQGSGGSVTGSPKTISINDRDTISASIDDIASGKVLVAAE